MPDPTKPLSPRPRRGRCRLCGLCLGSALLAIIVSALVHVFSSPTYPAPPPRFSVIIDGGSTGTRAHVFAAGPDGRPDLARSAVMRVSPGLSSFAADTARAGESLRPLLEFAREKIRGEGGAAATEVRLMATAGLRLLEDRVQEAILASCRDVLHASGFRFEDSWAKVIPGSDEGVYAWVAANYALGTLGGDPHKTIGIIELGGASAQLTFVSDEVLPQELSTNFSFGETAYTLYTNSFLNFGQNAAQDLFREIVRSRGSSENGTLVDPCAPKGYSHKREVMVKTSGASGSNLENQYVDNGSGNFKECRSSSLMMMQEGKGKKEKCQYQQCLLGSTFVPELRGHFLATENFYFTSKFFGLEQSSSLSDFVVAGEQLCNEEMSTLRQKYLNHSDEDFSRYCFSSAYIVALLHDGLGVPLDDKRIEYSNQVGDTQVEWALGAFIANTKNAINGGAARRVHNHRPLLAMLGAFSACGVFLVLRWRKPKTKIIYDLEKGRYIITCISWRWLLCRGAISLVRSNIRSTGIGVVLYQNVKVPFFVFLLLLGKRAGRWVALLYLACTGTLVVLEHFVIY